MASDLYYFYYTYGGDNSYYYGYGYATHGTYYSGETYNYNYNQSGAYGKYYIYTVNSDYGNYSDAGKVFVNDYYSSKTGTSYIPYNYSKGSPAGTSNLGSESDYINTSSGSAKFNDYYEA